MCAGLSDGKRSAPYGRFRCGSTWVWIGGVAGEIYRAAQGAGLYGALGQLTQTEVVVDVITGSSAGCVNGTAP